jgi:hypothetical protein
MSKRAEEHAFSIELNSTGHLRQFTISNGSREKVLLEGCLGELGELSFIEGAMLQIHGAHGILRMDLRDEDLRKLLRKEAHSKEKDREAVK